MRHVLGLVLAALIVSVGAVQGSSMVVEETYSVATENGYFLDSITILDNTASDSGYLLKIVLVNDEIASWDSGLQVAEDLCRLAVPIANKYPSEGISMVYAKVEDSTGRDAGHMFMATDNWVE